MNENCVCEGKGLCQCAIPKEQVNHPQHYGGENNTYEAIKVIEAWDLDFHLGNTVKYISRAGKKGTDKELQDLKKALWYLERKIQNIKDASQTQIQF
jgi:hypothetical protein